MEIAVIWSFVTLGAILVLCVHVVFQKTNRNPSRSKVSRWAISNWVAIREMNKSHLCSGLTTGCHDGPLGPSWHQRVCPVQSGGFITLRACMHNPWNKFKTGNVLQALGPFTRRHAADEVARVETQPPICGVKTLWYRMEPSQHGSACVEACSAQLQRCSQYS